MLINNWYVAATSDEVTDKPHRTRMVGVDFVLFRDESETLYCLSDVCCHRGGALHRGEVVGGCIACPYHGWEFNGEGQCVKIPAMGDDISIPKRARIDSYPIEERMGLIWVFVGDQAEADRPEIPDWFQPYLDNPEWRVSRYNYEWTDCNWERLCENSLDTSHPSFVHKRFGSRISPKATIVPIEHTEHGAKVTRERAAPAASQKRGAIADLLPKDRKTTRVSVEWSMIANAEMLFQEMTTEITQVLFSVRTPVDDTTVRSYGFQARNFLKEPEHDADRIEGLFEAVKEDHDIVRLLKPKHTVTSNAREMLIESDGMELAFRNKVAEWRNLGRYVDGDALERDGKREVFVVPSPARAVDPKGWVHQTVPLIASNAAVAEAAE
ncbi:MAG: Rieske 2Fe-2S domain-containing protein [Alphaproteobacteria bacterium]|nr:Rieske 2Fe-2S domain-containing protein [Alphaproteobacteria bacterium]